MDSRAGMDGRTPAKASHAWQVMYPPRACHAQGWLDVGDGHQVYWEEAGNPLGRPTLFVHGGPGVGCSAQDRRWFDPQRYRIVLFDQRGAGRSRPLGQTSANTTAHQLRDMEALRQHLGIAQWLLFGGSWGATLALAYAQQHPQRVWALVLRGVFTATAAEVLALYGPDSDGLLARMEAALSSGDDAQAYAAALRWWRLEQDLMDREDGSPPAAAPAPPVLLAQAAMGLHYARHGFFLGEGQLLRDAPRLASVAGHIVQGQRDLVTPAADALALHHAWPGSRLTLLASAGHASHHPEMAQQLIAATDAFATMPDTLAQAGDTP